jgi:hypothetical protein
MDVHTHEIILLKHTIEAWDTELEERVETITNLEQQLLQLQGPTPPALMEHEEIDTMSDVDED